MNNDTNCVRASDDSVVSVVRSCGVLHCEGAGRLPLPVQGPLTMNDQRCEGPSSETTFAYVARWSGGDPDAVRHTAERVIGAARDILVIAGLAPAPVDPATQQVLARPAPGRVRAPTTVPPNTSARRHRNLAR